MELLQVLGTYTPALGICSLPIVYQYTKNFVFSLYFSNWRGSK
jgi:hypothetical protein